MDQTVQSCDESYPSGGLASFLNLSESQLELKKEHHRTGHDQILIYIYIYTVNRLSSDSQMPWSADAFLKQHLQHTQHLYPVTQTMSLKVLKRFS